MQALCDGFSGAWRPNGLDGIDASALRVPCLWCARDRLQAFEKPVPPEWAAFTGAKCCRAINGCEGRPAPRLNRCRYHQILVNARKRKSDRRRRQKGAAPPSSPTPIDQWTVN